MGFTVSPGKTGGEYHGDLYLDFMGFMVIYIYIMGFGENIMIGNSEWDLPIKCD